MMHNERCSRQALEDAPEIAFRDVPWTTKTRQSLPIEEEEHLQVVIPVQPATQVAPGAEFQVYALD